ncbi:MAG TPA: hypothetical protein VGH28_31780 [Polyangiaceae bacterium]|jgi:hypothetical protein
MKKQIAWIFGSAAIVGLGMMSALSACSGDDTGTDSGTKDAAKDTTSNDVNTQDVVQNDSQPPQDGGSAECGSIPSLHVDEAGAIFCGFGTGDAGSIVCTTGTQCCLGGEVGQTFQGQDCVAYGAACDNPPADSGAAIPSIPVECAQNSDCTANGKTGNVCCLQGAKGPTAVAGCGYSKATNGTGVVCEAPTNGACTGATDIQICSADSDCPTGKTCQAGKWKILQVGFCM